MPAQAPPTDLTSMELLRALGRALRDRRKELGVTAIAAAEAAGMSRTTLHRVEQGEASVTIGAYMNAAVALGLELRWVDPRAPEEAAALPAVVRLGDYPALAQLAWQRSGDALLTPREALDLYERNWRHLDRGAMEPSEQAFLQRLVRQLGGGRPLV